MAVEISSIGAGFLAHRSRISRGYRYRELGLIHLNQSQCKQQVCISQVLGHCGGSVGCCRSSHVYWHHLF